MSAERAELLHDLSALADLWRNDGANDIADLLDRAIAALQVPQSEPVAWMHVDIDGNIHYTSDPAKAIRWANRDGDVFPLCACPQPTEPTNTESVEPAPVQAELTDDEITLAYHQGKSRGLTHRAGLRAVIAADRQLRARDGWVWVPIEPTEDMVEAAVIAYCDAKNHRKKGTLELAEVIYKAMIASVKQGEQTP